MKFSVFAGDGGAMRMATRITFESDKETMASIIADRTGMAVTEHDRGSCGTYTDASRAALWVAELLYRYRDYSLIVHPCGHSARGDESQTADVYPPGRQPRINVEGPI